MVVEDKYFRWYKKLRKKTEVIFSPTGNYELKIEYFKTGKNSWNYTKGTIVSTRTKNKIAQIKRNFSHFWYSWVNHSNGCEYLLCGEDYQGQTVVNLSKERTESYLPTEAENGVGFCWVGAYPSPDSNVLAVEGCVWACPYEIRFYEFCTPDTLPYREIGRVDSLEKVEGWKNGLFILSREIEIRKSDGVPYEMLSESEQDELDNGLVESSYKIENVSIDVKKLIKC